MVCDPYIQLAGGNSALALAMTVVSNLLGILIVSLIVTLSTFLFMYNLCKTIAYFREIFPPFSPWCAVY